VRTLIRYIRCKSTPRLLSFSASNYQFSRRLRELLSAAALEIDLVVLKTSRLGLSRRERISDGHDHARAENLAHARALIELDHTKNL